jgi:hypothetical protein
MVRSGGEQNTKPARTRTRTRTRTTRAKQDQAGGGKHLFDNYYYRPGSYIYAGSATFELSAGNYTHHTHHQSAGIPLQNQQGQDQQTGGFCGWLFPAMTLFNPIPTPSITASKQAHPIAEFLAALTPPLTASAPPVKNPAMTTTQSEHCTNKKAPYSN